jgi:poly-gamma-glutamate capsule biosynthesis protein CapA/YwtB (metallophosphatase superfamily)
MHRSLKKKIRLTVAIGVVSTICIAFVTIWFLTQRQANTPENSNTTQQHVDKNAVAQPSNSNPDRIRLIATGDVVAHDSVNANAEKSNGSYDYYQLMDRMAPIFSAANIRFCNQVTPAGGIEFSIKGYPKFNAPTELVRDLGRVGCNTVNMASNHSFDVSQAAISANVAAWEKMPNMLAFAGQNRSAAEHDSVKYFEQNGVKFAFLAYTTYINGSSPAQNSFGVTKYSRELADRQISEAKAAKTDIIIVSMRWGTEYSDTINSQQSSEAQFLADKGVSLILGHGPHVLQPVKKLNGAGGNETYVWFSLGNFLNTQIEADALFNGFGVVDYSTKTKKIISVSYLPIYMHYEWSTTDASSENLLARKNLEMFLLDDTTDKMIYANQLKTTVAAQRKRITNVLNTYTEIPIISNNQYFTQSDPN